MGWITLALLAAFFTSMTTILAKAGIKNVNSNFATLYRTAIVIVCSIVLCLISNSFASFNSLTTKNIVFLVLSGIATGCSWLCYYKALKLGDVSKVAPIDKSSFILTSILFIIFFFDATTNNGDVLTICMLALSMILMLVGTILMIGKNENKEVNSNKWLIYAILSAVFASLVSLFVKIGLQGISSNLGTLLRTIIVLIFAFVIVLVRKDYKGAKNIDKKSWLFLTLSGIATGGAWLCEYASLNIDNANPIAVNSIVKLSILLTIILSFILFKEKIKKRSIVGLILLVTGIMLVVLFSL